MSKAEKLSRVLLRMIGINFDSNVRRAAEERNFYITVRRGALECDFDLALGGLHVKHTIQSGILIQTQYLLQDRRKPRNILIVLVGRRTLRMQIDF
jgi:hypothetical protein